MNVTLSPSAPRYAVSDADDPFKKYWWAILMGIVFTGLWLLTPMLGEKSVGSTAINTSAPKVVDNVEQSAASGEGDTYLSMDGTGKKRKEDTLFGSSLYQAPDEPAPAAAATAGAAALGSGSGSSLASELKKVGESGSGGWSEKAQKGFNNPKIAGGSLSGMGAASGGSAGVSGSAAFGSNNAKVGFAGTKGLSGGSDIDAAPGSKGIAALKAASAQSLLASSNRSNDGARGGASQAFDGAKGNTNKIGGNVGGANLNYAALDAAPLNLKEADPKLNDKKIEPPAGADVGQSAMDDSQLGKQIAMQLAAAVVGGVIGGPVGGIVTSAIMQAIQRQMDQQEKIRQMEEKQQMDRAARRIGAKPSTPE